MADIKAPAIGYSITCNLDGNRQIVFQCFADKDATDREINADLDRVMGFANRQRAKFEVEEMQKEIDEIEKSFLQFEIEAARVEENFRIAQASFDVQILEVQAMRKAAFDAGYAEFRSAGREGTYKPKGARDVELQRLDGQVDEIKKQKAAQNDEKAAALANIAVNMDNRQKRVDTLKANMEAAKKLIEG